MSMERKETITCPECGHTQDFKNSGYSFPVRSSIGLFPMRCRILLRRYFFVLKYTFIRIMNSRLSDVAKTQKAPTSKTVGAMSDSPIERTCGSIT